MTDDGNLADADELFISITTDGDLYRNSVKQIQKNLLKKIDKGNYDSEKAEKLWMYLVDAGAKKYNKQYNSNLSKWFELFPISTRRLVAKRLSKKFESQVSLGEFDDV